MAGTAYHMEALRKTRVIERKTEAMRKMKESLGQPSETTNILGQNTESAPLVFSEAGHYAQNREFSKYPPSQTNHKKFARHPKEDIIRKPTPESVRKIQRDQVYYILHPHKLTYYKIGPERDMRQYDHSRNGPIVDRTKYNLKREFNFLGNSLSMLKSDIVPEHKPIPTCRRF